jgi:serine protease AprX
MLRRFVLQTFGRARQTQDSPIVPDVWLRYIYLAENIARARIAGDTLPDGAVDLLLTPWSGTPPGHIAKRLRDGLAAQHQVAQIAQSTSRVVARIDFGTLVRVVVPLTAWWQGLYPDLQEFQRAYAWLSSRIDLNDSLSAALSHFGSDIEFFRYAALVGFIEQLTRATTVKELEALGTLARRLGAGSHQDDQAEHEERPATGEGQLWVKDVEVLVKGYELAMGGNPLNISPAASLAEEPPPTAKEIKGIFLINLNRPATQSLFASRKTVKADAAERVFDIRGRGLAFAVIDGGIDATHSAFLKRSDAEFTGDEKKRLESESTISKADLERWSRVVATYDFTILRDIVANAANPELASGPNRAVILRLAADPASAKAFEHLKVRNDNARDLDWEIVEPLIRVRHDASYVGPGADHGTHVAGILAADLPDPADATAPLIGMCPDLSLYDLRVFDQEGRGDEFAILCAIEFVGWLNRDRAKPVVHGVNLSLALRHDVDSFACGQTPICDACNFLVGLGTVVVAAAGNTGFDGAANKQSLGTGYRAISVTDPGNADEVITVGSTHRSDPHAYGVSYFSGRGPTGDGRRKPDILAPGEKITSTIRGGRSQRMDGTSMAAPHVSGAAALLMARYPELIGRPRRIKEILMRAATDLKRDHDFQGAGLLDVLRALQSV